MDATASASDFTSCKQQSFLETKFQAQRPHIALYLSEKPEWPLTKTRLKSVSNYRTQRRTVIYARRWMPYMFKCPHQAYQCANRNIYISGKQTESIRKTLLPHFPSAKHVYYYVNMSTALQINDCQLRAHPVHGDPSLHAGMVVANWGLRCPRTHHILYAVIVPNDRAPTAARDTKWQWKLLGLHTAYDLQNLFPTYRVRAYEFPAASRSAAGFVSQLKSQGAFRIPPSTIDGVADWKGVRQVHRPSRSYAESKKKRIHRRGVAEGTWDVRMSEQDWIGHCHASWQESPAMPIVVVLNGTIGLSGHWIEWVKFVRLLDNQYVGLSCRYVCDEEAGKRSGDDEKEEAVAGRWCITTMCMDRVDLENKHRLLTGTCWYEPEKFDRYLSRFNGQWVGVDMWSHE